MAPSELETAPGAMMSGVVTLTQSGQPAVGRTSRPTSKAPNLRNGRRAVVMSSAPRWLVVMGASVSHRDAHRDRADGRRGEEVVHEVRGAVAVHLGVESAVVRPLQQVAA